jgi:UDP-N-acetylglucosamine:LPS N-acetylglucosamine transferase
MKYLLTGGGTGGHIYPAIAIANKILEHEKDAQILFAGTTKGLEAIIVPEVLSLLQYRLWVLNAGYLSIILKL